MTNNEKYTNIFKTAFGELGREFDATFTFADVEEWDSLTHMDLIVAIEDEFGIMFNTEDILNYGSFENGKKILAEKYGVDFE